MTVPQSDPLDEPNLLPAQTGNPRVDAVLESLEGLDDLPVVDQVAVFDKAHEELRAALDAPAETSDAPDQSAQPPGA